MPEIISKLLLLIMIFNFCEPHGSMTSIAISYGENPTVCAIQASKEQEILCWGKNTSLVEESSLIPPLMGLSGGSGFMCGLQASNNNPFCFLTNLTTTMISSSLASIQNIVPPGFKKPYDSIAAGESHICALSREEQSLDCWPVQESSSKELISMVNAMKNMRRGGNLQTVVAGSNFSCVLDSLGELSCWGDMRITSELPDDGPAERVFYESISAGSSHVCGVERSSGEARCWGSNQSGQLESPRGVAFSELAAGSEHTCGILRNTHEIQCWGSITGAFLQHRRTEFLTLASGNGIYCGVREGNLLAECWASTADSTATGTGKPQGTVPEYAPPPELFSPGLCEVDIPPSPCGLGFFEFNASNHGVEEAICEPGRRICSPCAVECPEGMFLASPCTGSEDRVCIECCDSGECQEAERCPGVRSVERSQRRKSILILAGVSSSFVFLVVILTLLRIRRMLLVSRRKSLQQMANATPAVVDGRKDPILPAAGVQIFRLADLRDAFKESNEIGRGRYGAVYKASLPDGTHIAVKRASAARRIQFTGKEFDSELEILCKMRHENLVNLVGYCDQMGERLLAYEFMPNGSLFDHLHCENKSHTCPVVTRWGTRLSIASQVAKALDFLHKNKVVHGNLNSSNVMLDRDWNARVSDFGYLGANRPSFESGYGGKTDPGKAKVGDDIYSFGVVMLELLTGRKAVIDGEFDPPVRLVDWAILMIGRGKLESLVDVQCGGDQVLMHSSSKQGLIRFAEIAEICVSSSRSSVTMCEVLEWVQELVFQQQQQHHSHHYHMPSANIPCINVRI